MNNLRIYKDNKGNEYVLMCFVVGDNYLVPYVMPEGRSLKYWEHHFVPRDTWINMKSVDFDNFNLTKIEYQFILVENDMSHGEILNKYHNSF